MMLQGARVLVVEDEAMVAMLVEDYLAAIGCTVVASASRLEPAMQQARDVAIDVAVLDVNLAGKLSYPVAEILRARRVPFIFATGYGVNAVPDTLRGAPVLTKPFTGAQLERALHAAVPGTAAPG